MNDTPLYASKRTARSLWQQYRIYRDRLELQAWILFHTVVVPVGEIRPSKSALPFSVAGKGFTSGIKLHFSDLCRPSFCCRRAAVSSKASLFRPTSLKIRRDLQHQLGGPLTVPRHYCVVAPCPNLDAWITELDPPAPGRYIQPLEYPGQLSAKIDASFSSRKSRPVQSTSLISASSSSRFSSHSLRLWSPSPSKNGGGQGWPRHAKVPAGQGQIYQLLLERIAAPSSDLLGA